MKYMKIRLKADVVRSIPINTERNRWFEGDEFYVRQEKPGYGMVVCEGPDQGIGIQPEAAQIIETYASYSEMHMAAFGD